MSTVEGAREIGTVLVTGGCGFIGSNFIRYIMSHWSKVCVVNLDSLTYAGRPGNLADIADVHGGQRYFFVQGNICDRRLVESLMDGSYFNGHESGPDLVPDVLVNFAAETHVDRSIDDAAPFIRTNVQGTQTLLEAARQEWNSGIGAQPRRSRRFLQISTDEVYGSLGEEGCFTEQSPLTPSSPYAASKAGADLLALSYHHTYGLPIIITRSSNNYGPYQFTEKFIPLMITKALGGQPLPLYGDGRNVRDWLHVEDNCAAIAHVIEQGEVGSVYNIGAGAERRNLEVAQQILGILRKPTSLISFVDDRLGHDWRYAVDWTQLRNLGWAPRWGFDEGLRQTVGWYVDQAATEGR